MTADQKSELDFSCAIFAGIILAPFVLAVLVMGVDQIHDWLCAIYGWPEWPI